MSELSRWTDWLLTSQYTLPSPHAYGHETGHGGMEGRGLMLDAVTQIFRSDGMNVALQPPGRPGILQTHCWYSIIYFLSEIIQEFLRLSD